MTNEASFRCKSCNNKLEPYQNVVNANTVLSELAASTELCEACANDHALAFYILYEQIYIQRDIYIYIYIEGMIGKKCIYIYNPKP